MSALNVPLKLALRTVRIDDASSQLAILNIQSDNTHSPTRLVSFMDFKVRTV